MRALGDAARGDGDCYLTGGGTAVLLGWRPTTLDVDIKLEPVLRRDRAGALPLSGGRRGRLSQKRRGASPLVNQARGTAQPTSTTWRSAFTHCGSNWVPAFRRISASAAARVRRRRYGRGSIIAW